MLRYIIIIIYEVPTKDRAFDRGLLNRKQSKMAVDSN